jgi:hypothetical protein
VKLALKYAGSYFRNFEISQTFWANFPIKSMDQFLRDIRHSIDFFKGFINQTNNAKAQSMYVSCLWWNRKNKTAVITANRNWKISIRNAHTGMSEDEVELLRRDYQKAEEFLKKEPRPVDATRKQFGSSISKNNFSGISRNSTMMSTAKWYKEEQEKIEEISSKEYISSENLNDDIRQMLQKTCIHEQSINISAIGNVDVENNVDLNRTPRNETFTKFGGLMTPKSVLKPKNKLNTPKQQNTPTAIRWNISNDKIEESQSKVENSMSYSSFNINPAGVNTSTPFKVVENNVDVSSPKRKLVATAGFTPMPKKAKLLNSKAVETLELTDEDMTGKLNSSLAQDVSMGGDSFYSCDGDAEAADYNGMIPLAFDEDTNSCDLSHLGPDKILEHLNVLTNKELFETCLKYPHIAFEARIIDQSLENMKLNPRERLSCISKLHDYYQTRPDQFDLLTDDSTQRSENAQTDFQQEISFSSQEKSSQEKSSQQKSRQETSQKENTEENIQQNVVSQNENTHPDEMLVIDENELIDDPNSQSTENVHHVEIDALISEDANHGDENLRSLIPMESVEENSADFV